MDVFSAFPKAILSGVWELGSIQHDTAVGERFVALLGPFEVIVDEVIQTSLNTAPDAEAILNDTLLYARPEQMPTTNPASLGAGYLWHNLETGQYHEITEVGVGKNQETGVIEHIEFKLRPTGAPDGDQ